MIRRIRRKYHTAHIPSDANTGARQRFYLATLSANKTFKDFVIQAIWRLLWDDGEYVRVVRESYTWEGVKEQ